VRAALYTRVSTKEQTEGLSLDNQRLRLTEWAKREDWEIVGDYQDAGFSGRSTNRPAFQQMLADAERGGFDILLARVRERVFRNSLDARVYADRLKTYGVTIRYLDEPQSEDTPTGFLMESQMTAFAEYFSRDLSAKTKLGKQARLRSGRSNGHPPFGYAPDWTVHTTEGVLAQELFSRYASGSWSHAQLSEWLSTTLGRRFGIARVTRLLRNPIYIGRLHNGESGVHPPLVTEAVWYRVAEVAKERESKPVAYHQKSNAFVLSGIGRHASCGSPIWGHTKAKHLRRYRCSDKDRGGSCVTPSVLADDLEDSFSNIITKIHLPDHWQDEIRELTMLEPMTDEATERKRLEQKLARTRRALVDDLIDYEEGKRIIRATERELSMLSAPKVYEAAGEALTDLPALWPHLTILERRNVAQSMLEAVYVEGTQVLRLSPKPLFVPLFDRYVSQR
jgi:site-specific DNA recombinase